MLRFHGADTAEVPSGMDQLFENNLLERSLGFRLGLELLAKLLERGTVFLRDDGVLGSESMRAGVLRRLALSFFSARSGTELGIGGVCDLAGCRHVERSFAKFKFQSDCSGRLNELERWRERMLWGREEIEAGGCREWGLCRLPAETRQSGDKIKVLVAGYKRGVVLAGEGGNPNVVLWDRVAGAF